MRAASVETLKTVMTLLALTYMVLHRLGRPRSYILGMRVNSPFFTGPVPPPSVSHDGPSEARHISRGVNRPELAPKLTELTKLSEC